MEYHNNRNPVFPVQLLHQLQDLDLISDIQIRGRFIQKQNLCILGKRHGDPDSLPLAAGKTADLPVPVFFCIGYFHCPPDLSLIRFTAALHQFHMRSSAEGYQTLCRDVVRRRVVLVHNRYFSRKFFQRKILNILPPQENISFSRIKIPGHQIKQRGFPASVCPHDRRNLSFLYLKRSILKHPILSIGKGQIPHFHGRLLISFMLHTSLTSLTE